MGRISDLEQMKEMARKKRRTVAETAKAEERSDENRKASYRVRIGKGEGNEGGEDGWVWECRMASGNRG